MKNPPKILEKIRQYGYTLITGSLTVGLITAVIDFFVNPLPIPPPIYPAWMITIFISIAGAILVGISHLSYKIWIKNVGSNL